MFFVGNSLLNLQCINNKAQLTFASHFLFYPHRHSVPLCSAATPPSFYQRPYRHFISLRSAATPPSLYQRPYRHSIAFRSAPPPHPKRLHLQIICSSPHSKSVTTTITAITTTSTNTTRGAGATGRLLRLRRRNDLRGKRGGRKVIRIEFNSSTKSRLSASNP